MGNKKLIGVVLAVFMSGCAAQKQNIDPNFFIKFDSNSGDVNNVFALKQRFGQTQHLFKEKQPTYVLVAHGQTEGDFNLALERAHAISQAINTDVRILVKKQEREEQADLLAVHAVNDWNRSVRAVFESQDYTRSVELDAVISSDNARFYYRFPVAKSYQFKSKSADKQLVEFAKKIGWEIDIANANEKLLSDIDIKSVRINTLESIASTNEVRLIFEELVEHWLPGHTVSVQALEQKIIVKEG
ncbi:hypothetical protein OPW39_15825 [Vibrio europaeus]|uniref:hypothetical protein n=1 Tax=Vibrio europaeus TaxID=300876 RepID=UPI00233EC837|nr:hypothetical protein [Vibrio europaeus]MDC5870277.1 hypothetical protein [Vibrio europaeus]